MNENETTAYIENRLKYTINTDLNESLVFYCNTCRTMTSHKTIVKASIVDDDPTCDNYERFECEDYRISECSGCHSVRFVENVISSEDKNIRSIEDFKKRLESRKLHCRIYPISEEGALTESRLDKLEFVLPPRVKRIYEETLIAIKNKQFVIAGIGLRGVLDAVCRDKGIGKGKITLAERLNIMLKENLITPDQKGILDAVKDLGNDSAHEGKVLKSYEVERALIVVEHLLDTLYLLPEMKQEFENDKQNISFVNEVFGTEPEEK